MKAHFAVLFLLCAVGTGAAGAARAGTWTDMWSTREQQAQKLLDSKHPDQAAPLFSDPRRRAYAQMEAGQFDKAAKSLAPFKDADSQYNRGNALAHTGQLREALSAYDAALAASPGNKDVIRNRDLVKRALDQQQAAQSGQQGGSKGQPGSQGSKGGQSQGGNHSPGGGQPQPGDRSQANNQGQRGGQGSQAQQANAQQGGNQAQGSQSQANNQGQRGGQDNPSQQANAQQGGNQAQGSQSQANNQGQGSQGQDRQAQASQSQGGQQGNGASPGDGRSAAGNQAGGQAQGQQSQANADRPGNNAPGEGALAPNGQQTNGQTGAAGLNAANAQQDANAALRYRQSQQGRTPPGASPSAPNQASVLGGEGKARPGSSDVPPPKPPSEQAMALDQWLRGIPDDSAELLRRKFLIEHMLKQQQRDQL